jgi:UDP-GlcNAc:undecaprenyl-phosphate GlcNAc-1-phosphate transferase
MIYLVSLLLSIIISFITTKIVLTYSLKNKVGLSIPRKRDVHTKPIPRIGGIGIYISFWIVVGIILLLFPESLSFVESKIINIDMNLLGIIIASTIWVIIGLVDDTKGLKPSIKLFFQFICATIIVLFGVKIWWISNPLGGLNIGLEQWTYLLVPIWIVLLMNVINWFDGIDGLSSNISAVTCIILFLLSIDPNVNQPATALLCIILLGVLIGFIPYNWNPAKIFLGDTGSGFLGLMLAVFAIISGAKLATAFLVLGIPILDALVVIFSRLKNKKSIFSADKTHIHHKFLKAGLSVKQTVIFLTIISIVFGIVALKTQTQEKFQAFLWLMLIMGIILLTLTNIIKNRNKNVSKK